MSDNQCIVLENLKYGRMTPTQLIICVGSRWKSTLDSLIRSGKVKYYPYGANGEGCYGLVHQQ